MKTTLLIMAAGLGTRFGKGIKQLEPVGLHGELIMDYSIHDAIRAGFDKVVFILRREIEADFREVIGNRVEALCGRYGVAVAYAFQDLHDVPGQVPPGRTKPWGTGQAVLAAREEIDGPFMVINADDYYGKKAFQRIRRYLAEGHEAYCMAGFILKNTLSEHGGVTRGICRVRDGMLADVVETANIVKSGDGATADGVPIDADGYVSMNMWGFPDAGYLRLLEEGFRRFFREEVPANPLKAEFLLPVHIGRLLREGKVQVTVLKTDDQWFGVTYQEDTAAVAASFRRMLADGVYQENLYGDLE